MKGKGYQFANEFYFEPVLNDALKQELIAGKDKYTRKNQILLYGRPGTVRNAFELIIASLNEWAAKYEKAGEWTILSAGESFDEIELVNGMKVKSIGKVSLQEYARVMLESKIGISLMVSPHPSYPPLEMSSFGMKVITNKYDNKDLSGFNDNMISLDNCSAATVAKTLEQLCSRKDLNNKPVTESAYFEGADGWDELMDELVQVIE